jgi:hypothetical protein
MIFRILLALIYLSLVSFRVDAQDSNGELYEVGIKKYLEYNKTYSKDTVLVISDMRIKNNFEKPILKQADSIFFKNQKKDTSFYLIKILPPKIIKTDLVLPINSYDFKRREAQINMIFIGTFYCFFKYDCKRKKYLFYKVENDNP